MSDIGSVPRDAHRLSCLGPFAFTSPTGTKLGFRTRKQMALLLVLARRPGEPVLKEQLLDLLWSEDEEAGARHSLSQSVSLLNKAFGSEAVTSPDKDQLSLREGIVWLDVTAFEALVAARRHSEARALWRGNLLDGFRVRRAPNFERWAESERQRLARLIRGVLRAAADAERGAGDWAAMRQTADALLELDGLDEDAMLVQLESLVLLGDRTAALRRYREFENLLRAELGAEPGPRLRAWSRRQLRGEVYDAGADARATPVQVHEDPVIPTMRPVYGRREEFATLWQTWESACAGGGSFVLLRGPAGIGKSALAVKLANQVHVAGGAVVLVRCFRTEKSVPFAPISALVRQLSRLPGFVALNPLWIGELSRLAPELRERFPGIPQPMEIDDSARARLCDASLQAAASIAVEQPLLVVVDDLQDADEATLALLHYFGRQASSQPALLLGIARSPVGDGDFERVFVATARTAGFVRVLELGALPDEEIRRVVQQVLAQRGLEAPPRTLELVAAAAQGNPLQAIELAVALPGRDGRLAEEWLAGIGAAADQGVESFERTAAERLAQLPDDARLLAGTLALAGRPLSDYDLAAVTALPTSALASAISTLEAVHFIRRTGATLAFAHERYRSSAEAAVPAAGRRATHLALARFLVKSAAGSPVARYEVAFHYAGAHRLREARANALAAGRYAASVGAVRERAAALELARQVTSGYDGRLAADLAGCYLDLKEFDRLDALCAEARATTGLEAGLAEEFRLLEIAAEYHSGREPLLKVQAELEQLLASAGPAFRKTASACNLLMRTADKTGRHAAVKRVARKLRREAGSDRGQPSPYALFASAYVIAKYYWPERALALLEKASLLAAEAHDWGLEHSCRDGIGVVLMQLGRYDESISRYRLGLALARKTLDPLAEATSLNNIANVQMAKGAFGVAAELLDESARIDAHFPRWPFRLYRYYNRGILALLDGDIDAALSDLRLVRDRSADADLWPISVSACAALGVCSVRRGDFGTLRSLRLELDKIAEGRARSLSERWVVEATVAWDTAVNLGQWERARTDVERALRELRRRDVDHWLRLRLEWIALQEHVAGVRLPSDREDLAMAARSFGASAVERAALPTAPPASAE